MRVKIEVIFPANLKDEAIICGICKQFNIVLKIIEASFSTETGWAILILEATETELKKTFEYLKNKGIEIKNTQQET